MGVEMRRWLPILLVAAFSFATVGCGSTISAETVKERDNDRTIAAKNMPGNDIPNDPADD